MTQWSPMFVSGKTPHPLLLIWMATENLMS